MTFLKRLRRFTIIALCASVLGSIGTAKTHTLKAIEDAYVQGGKSKNSAVGGKSSDLLVKNDSADYTRAVLIKFDLSSLGTALPTAAKLRLYLKENDMGLNHNLDVSTVASNWSESTVTWENAPQAGSTVKEHTIDKSTSGTWIEVDVKSLLTSTNSTLSFRMEKSENRNGWWVLDSRENSSGRAPQLVLTTPDVVTTPEPTTGTTTVKANADAYIQSGNKSNSAVGGSTDTMIIKNHLADYSRESLVRFSLAGLNPSSASAATLRVYLNENTMGSDLNLEVHSASGTWSENSVTWNSAPGTAGAPAVKLISKSSKNTWVEVDVSAIVKSAGSDLTLRLKNPKYLNGWWIFDSRNNGSGRAPELALNYSTSGGGSVPIPSTPDPEPASPITAADVLIEALGSSEVSIQTGGIEAKRIDSLGRIGIGTSQPGNKLDVAGTLRAHKIIVQSQWADYVFEEGYELRQLDHVAEFITNHGRLPGVPSADEVHLDGISLGDSQRILLEKIEELTLYAIQQDRLLQAKAKQMKTLHDKTEALLKRIERLEQQ